MGDKKSILLFNPRSAASKPRIPNSILQVAASVAGQYNLILVDGNLERDPEAKIMRYLEQENIFCIGMTVMPGPQLRQAIPISKAVRQRFPQVKMVWGGYFPSNQPEVVLHSGYIDVIINGPGDRAFPMLLQQWEAGKALTPDLPNLIYLENGRLVKTKKDELYDQDSLPDLPYTLLNQYYPIQHYLGKTFLGQRTIAYHSSFGCPFTCSFCAVVPIYNARWKGKSAEKIYADVRFIKQQYGGDAIEFHDNNFFVSEKRTVEFSRLVEKENMGWWGEGRIDTIDKYKDDSLKRMRDAGCKMIFLGAESGNDAILKQMDKGGTQTGEQIRRFAGRMAEFDIIPELSFVLGTPAATPELVARQVEEEIAFIRDIKRINPRAEIIIYVYSPVPVEGSELYNRVKETGFRFPQILEDWIAPQWENFDLRKNPLTPWLTPSVVDRIRNFETVLNGYYPTVSDFRLGRGKRMAMRTLAGLRYRMQLYNHPYEIKALQKFWKYRQPETEGFYQE